jgi:hypothetical protein
MIKRILGTLCVDFLFFLLCLALFSLTWVLRRSPYPEAVVLLTALSPQPWIFTRVWHPHPSKVLYVVVNEVLVFSVTFFLAAVAFSS